MNILNRRRFDDQMLRAAYRVVKNSLLEGGVWIVGGEGNAAFTSDATVYRKSGGRLRSEIRLGRGYSADDLVSALD